MHWVILKEFQVPRKVRLPAKLNVYMAQLSLGSKRIGLLFSEAKMDWILDPQHTKDVDDIVVNGENFSDGCGLISTQFAQQLSRKKRIIFHGKPYTPSVYQIRSVVRPSCFMNDR